MNKLEKILFSISEKPIHILDRSISIDKYTSLDLSKSNSDLLNIKITNPVVCQAYITETLQAANAEVAFGGYLEKRNLYADKGNFSGEKTALRNIHLGIDYWAKEGTIVITPLRGKVHSFKNNTTSGDYGPTIILKHQISDIYFYTLYGHLSVESLSDLYIGKEFEEGSVLGYLGATAINVNYAPHLHFQIINDMQGCLGDYPGVCALSNLDYYTLNCPNPNLLLKL
ncbi:peptidoglycan DD-metalloendopeptidase family protein [Cellulophaga sp. HaHaR_3_176]|uniref:peptidoglycan DD-metalloendopeptidase family protein n=1 Tax=Cellulophaga sp. HaHaR_3_176 TaxID=1942464 RepID=UPI001C1FF4A2|nr:peptidoglycan DD-metalloendopeptidase family protein [Cellulophaga sp. HaHaR_3_176]QWX84566.1 peptidoglycan DD-metalloendopeptidase family protein [Cellulophaga sp. HaHaR_3_176]